MTKFIVDVMLKSEILDPQGQAISLALARNGITDVSVRQGKRFELYSDQDLSEEEVTRIADSLLANTVIEDYQVHKI